jgi:hypothetical protein
MRPDTWNARGELFVIVQFGLLGLIFLVATVSSIHICGERDRHRSE